MLPDHTLKPWVVIVGPPHPGAIVSDIGRAGIGHFVYGCEFDSEAEAQEKADQLNRNNRTWTFQVYHNRSASVLSKTDKAVNDHVCPTCKNDRCSKQEKTCWKCGNKL